VVNTQHDDDRDKAPIRGVDQTPIELLMEAVKGLGARIDDKALLPEEVREFRRLLPQLQELLESKRRWQWIWKRVGAFLLAAPALGVAWQGVVKLLEWIRGQ
jgi:hypothetical protein